MKRDESHFADLENLVSFSYSNFGNSLQVYENKFEPNAPLGYCYKYSANGITIYTVVHSPIGRAHTDRRIVAHEYGHITLGHLNGIHEQLDSRVLWTINNQRADLEKGINESLGIDYADKLLNRVIDDPSLNHSLHNIAMDFEVNQRILSQEDIEEMEEEISEVIIDSNPALKEMKKKYEDILAETPDSPDIPEEQKEVLKKTKDELGKALGSMKIKLMLPSRYHFPDGSPFPDDLTYPEYLILIIKNLDQFVKMLVSIKNGGDGDTSKVTEEQLKDALQEDGNDNGQNGNQQGGSMASLDDLMESCGMSKKEYSGTRPKDGNDKGSQGGKPDQNGKQGQGGVEDHGSESRDDADEKRSQGKIKPSPGCGSSGGPTDTMEVVRQVKDPVDEAIDEVIKNFSSKVCGFTIKKDMTYLYNRGINRAVIAPVYHTKVSLTSLPRIVFLIDVSGSMDRGLVNRILGSIAKKMSRIKKGLKYDVITWSTYLGDHFKDLDPKKPIPYIHVGGGTSMAEGIKYFREHYGKESILVLISDFEDYLDEWEKETSTMSGYDLYGFCYGYYSCDRKIKNFKIRNFVEK